MDETGLTISTFRQGVHPPEHKDLTEAMAIKVVPEPQKVTLPLSQHIGAPCKSLVKAKDTVQAGQKIAESEAFVSAPIHATISGQVKAINKAPHPIGIEVEAIVIERDSAEAGESAQEKVEGAGLDIETADQEQLLTAIKEAGIVGMGGAAFPTHVKLSPPENKPIDTVILNGCECEPFLTADHRTMLKYTDDCTLGLRAIMKVVGADKGYIAIEMNKADAIRAMREKVNSGDNGHISVIGLKVKYPQGAEKMLIKAILNREVPSGGLPMDVGAVVDNVGTAAAITRAVVNGEPLTKRVVTVTGGGINKPANLLVTLGTSFNDVIEFCGGLKESAAKVIMGGPMMGLSQYTLEAPVVKATSGILVLTEEEAKLPEEMPCIRCARCVDHCPVGLLPVELGRLAKGEKWERLLEYSVHDCIECGCCAYICPSKIPLVHLIKLGKLKVKRET